MKDKIEKAKCYIKTLPLFFGYLQLVDDKPIQNHFIAGYEIAEKDLKQKIKDLYNKYCSQLKEENNPKLTKVINKERVLILSSKIQVLGELKNKLNK